MKRSKKPTGAYTVTGPYEKDHAVPTVGAGISVAQTLASRYRRSEGVLTWYVRDLLRNTTYATVTKTEGGVIETWPNV